GLLDLIGRSASFYAECLIVVSHWISPSFLGVMRILSKAKCRPEAGLVKSSCPQLASQPFDLIELTDHATLIRNAARLFPCEPTQIVRFVADLDRIGRSCGDQKPSIVMNVLRIVLARRNQMAIEIEGQRMSRVRKHFLEGKKGQVDKARFFLGLSQSDARYLRIPVGVATELQPHVQLAVMGQENTAQILGHDQGGTGDMPWRAASFKAIRPF